MIETRWHSNVITAENSALAQLINEELYNALSAEFDYETYKLQFPDVNHSSLSPFEHFLNYGYFEERPFTPTGRKAESDFYLHTQDILNPHFAAKCDKTVNDYLIQKNAISTIFDTSYYLYNYALRLPPPLAVDHYLTTGKALGYSVNTYFNAREYAEMYEDIRNADMDEAFHFAQSGLYEGRLPLKLNRLDKYTRLTPDILQKLSEYFFDEEFYVKAYPDVAISDIHPLKHYVEIGWKEKRQPKQDINYPLSETAFNGFLQRNINPLLVLNISTRTGIKPSDSEEVSLIASCQVKPQSKLHVLPSLDYQDKYSSAAEKRINNHVEKSDICGGKHSQAPPAHTIDAQFIENKLAETSDLIVSISQDVYTRNNGDLQVCIAMEQNVFNKNGNGYLHIAPYLPQKTLSKELDSEEDVQAQYYEINIDGEYTGACTKQTLINVVEKRESRVIFVFHALQGHSDKMIADLIDSAPKKEVIVWLHDYFILCEGANLLKNGDTFCKGPATNSEVCSDCMFGIQREKHLERITNLLSSNQYQLIVPSKNARKIWLDAAERAQLPKPEHIKVRNHLELGKSYQRKEPDIDTKIKIAFVGPPDSINGWHLFLNFINVTMLTERYEYFHIGPAPSQNTEDLRFIRSVTKAADPNATYKAVWANSIDYIYIPSSWSETFNLACYESIAAGAKVITHPSSGNVSDFLSRSPHGVVVVNDEILREEHEYIIKKPVTKTYYKLDKSEMSYNI